MLIDFVLSNNVTIAGRSDLPSYPIMISKKRDIRLLLDNVRSVHNVGSIFRTAETIGVSKIYCIETTPTPFDRFGRKRKDFAKVSLGAENIIECEYLPNRQSVAKVLKSLKNEGFKAIALEQDRSSIDYKKIKINGGKANGDKTLIILGNEVDGVAPYLLKSSDEIAEIPIQGKKESLNVSVAAGIFLYRLLDD